MAIINWSESYSVKIETIDDQHKVLFNLINEFYEKLNNNDKNKNLTALIHGMRDYTMLHFSAEEKLMQNYAYPDYENHKKEHVKFIETVNEYIERINAGKLIISVEITNYLKNWISNHISKTDKKYSDFFVKKGVK